MKYKCRPAEECYWDDPYYVKEFEVNAYTGGPWSGPRQAAEEFAAFHCNRKSEYGEMDVQVLMPDGWHTFEVNVVSVPEFIGTKKKGAEVVPDTFRCDECKKRFPVGEREADIGFEMCRPCYLKWLGDDEEDAN